MAYDLGKDPAFPLGKQLGNTGLTKREYFAIHILSGMSSNQDLANRLTIQKMAKHAIRTADVLIQGLEELDGEPEEKIGVKPSDAYWADREADVEAMDEVRSEYAPVDRKYYGD